MGTALEFQLQARSHPFHGPAKWLSRRNHLHHESVFNEKRSALATLIPGVEMGATVVVRVVT